MGKCDLDNIQVTLTYVSSAYGWKVVLGTVGTSIQTNRLMTTTPTINDFLGNGSIIYVYTP
jgi:hypothetical protein